MNLRSGLTLPQSSFNVETAKMADEIRQVVMTPEMLQALITGIGQNLNQHQVQNPPGLVNLGNFSKCTHRFDGTKNRDVHAFLDSIAVYKECLQISDDNALKGFPMLLEGQAATWWQGVKNSTHTFDEATQALKHAFGYSKPAHQVYRELFQRDQKEEEKTDLFVSRCRALLSHLPSTPVLPEAIQLDMVYGLLHLKIRERVPRDKLQNFEDLINEARKAEVTLQEIQRIPDVVPGKSMQSKESRDSSKPKLKKQCAYCKAYGHIRDECRKLSQKKAETPPTSTSSPTSLDSTKPQVTCFGCGAIGYIRSNCPTCKSKPMKSEPQDNPVEFRYYNTSEGLQNQPLVSIEVSRVSIEVSSIENPDVPLGKYHISALTPYHGKENQAPLHPLRRRGRPPKGRQVNAVQAGSPGAVKKIYNLRPPKRCDTDVGSRSGRTRDPKGEIVRREPSAVPSLAAERRQLPVIIGSGK